MPASTSSSALSVFQFLDAREFLAQIYEEEKKRNSVFSHRFIARSMNARSSSFFKDVLSGRIGLNPTRARAFAKLFKLNARETEYFENLALYTQAETEEEKKHYLRKLSDTSTSRHTLLSAMQMEYFKKGVYAAVRELVAIHEFQGDYAELGALLEPPIPASEAIEAVQLLLKLKLIKKNAQGRYERVDRVLSSGNQADPAKVKPAIRQNLALAQRALDLFPAEIRPFSYLTVSVSEESVALIRDRLRMIRREILEIVTQEQSVDRLYQLNFQLFPISKVVKPRK